MRDTRIIELVSLEENVVVEKSKSLFAFLEQGVFDEMMSFDAFLTQVNLSKDEYIQAIQCTLRQPTLFLKQKLSHIWNKSFSKDMPVMWKENTNAQYMLNAYVAASYCTSYMRKINKSMTSEFRKIHKEHERSHIDAIQMIHTHGNTFLNLQQMSAQQAVHIALSLPLTCGSRNCVFINTSPL
jgi:urocanate hydratase